MRTYYHIILVVSFILIPIFSSPDFEGDLSVFRHVPFQHEIFRYVLLIGFFYLHYYFLFPKLYETRKYALYFLSIPAVYFLICNLPYAFIPDRFPIRFPHQYEPMFGPKPPMGPDFMRRYFHVFFPFLFVWLAAVFLRGQEKKQQDNANRTKAELQSLRFQLEPHFLFNTLNSIYSLILTQSQLAPTALLKLSNVMRYIVSESAKDFVPLEREILHLRDFISLQLLKTDDSLRFQFTTEGSTDNLKIAPMILVNFIENAFKYGYNADSQSEISIEIKIIEKDLLMRVYNKKVARLENTENNTSVGVNNTLRRLQYLYPHTHLIEINNGKDEYEVNLRIKLHD